MSLIWYGELSKNERRSFWACLGGYTLDSLDSQMYALLAPLLITIVGFTKPEIGMLTTTGLIGNALGGWVAGVAADRFGRKRLLQITILWVAGFSGLAALCSTHTEFFAVRFLQGMGFGGEAAVAGVLLGEVVRSHLRGRVVTGAQAGYGLGYALALIVMPILFSMFEETIAWRIMFAVGAVPGVLALYVRKYVPESEAYENLREERRAGAAVTPFWNIFDRANRRTSIFGVMLSTGILGGGFAIHAWLPTYLRLNLHLQVTKTAGYLALSVTGLILGPLIGGFISDRIGRRQTFLTLVPCHAAVVVALLFMQPSLTAVLFLILLQGTLQGATAGTMLPTFSELFATDVRGTGVGFCITGGRGIGSVSTTAVGLLATTMPLNEAMGTCTLSAFCLAILAAAFLPDRSGAALMMHTAPAE
ncbi:MFS transporter [Novosphingobium flavum]|uniref:MFS transporter n=1 Tax=Novosphingobium flavum TaxID=1778672 RepID=A0A7X1KKR0_9SPHN|nr:MFS transporter [Novosphingobium flavum]MBC2664811.1 MFS transporter [Novosphingobium flavum]